MKSFSAGRFWFIFVFVFVIQALFITLHPGKVLGYVCQSNYCGRYDRNGCDAGLTCVDIPVPVGNPGSDICVNGTCANDRDCNCPAGSITLNPSSGSAISGSFCNYHVTWTSANAEQPRITFQGTGDPETTWSTSANGTNWPASTLAGNTTIFRLYDDITTVSSWVAGSILLATVQFTCTELPANTPTPTLTPTPTCAPVAAPSYLGLTLSPSDWVSKASLCSGISGICVRDTTPTWNWSNTNPGGRCATTQTSIFNRSSIDWNGLSAGVGYWNAYPGQILTSYTPSVDFMHNQCFNVTASFQNPGGDSGWFTPERRIQLDTQPPALPGPGARGINCTYTGTSFGVRYFDVNYYWNAVTDNGCADLQTNTYWPQVFIQGGNWLYNSWTSSTSVGPFQVNENNTVVGNLLVQDYLNNQSVRSGNNNRLINCANCPGCPGVPTPTPTTPGPTATPTTPPAATPTIAPSPTCSCVPAQYNATYDTMPITCSWTSGDNNMQMYDTLGNWYFNTTASSPTTVSSVNNQGVTPAIPVGRTVRARTTRDFVNFSNESTALTCTRPALPTVPPTPTGTTSTLLTGRVFRDTDDNGARAVTESLLTSSAPFTNTSFSYSCNMTTGQQSGSANYNALICGANGPYRSDYIIKNNITSSCTINAQINTTGWYFTQNSCHATWAAGTCSWGGGGNDYSGGCNSTDPISGNCNSLTITVPGADIRGTAGNFYCWFGVNSAPATPTPTPTPPACSVAQPSNFTISRFDPITITGQYFDWAFTETSFQFQRRTGSPTAWNPYAYLFSTGPHLLIGWVDFYDLNASDTTCYQYRVRSVRDERPATTCYAVSSWTQSNYICPGPTSTPTLTPVPTETPTPTVPVPTSTSGPTPTPLPNAWFQTQGGDSFAGNNYTNLIPPEASGENINKTLMDTFANYIAGPGITYYGTGFSIGSGIAGFRAETDNVFPERTTYNIIFSQFNNDMSQPISNSSINLSSISSLGTLGDPAVLYWDGDLTLSGDWPVSFGRYVVIFVTGDVNIATTNTTLTVAPGAFLGIIAQGNIYIANNMTQVDGFYFSNGIISTRNPQNLTPDSTPDQQLKLNGTFVANDFNLYRNRGVDNANGPAEVFALRPDFAFSAPAQLKRAFRRWSELTP